MDHKRERFGMIVISFGSPSALSYAVVDLARRLLEEAVESHAVLQVVDLAGFVAQRRCAAERGRVAVLAASDCPAADLVAHVAAAGEPVILCCEALDETVRYNMRARGMTLAAALSFATQVLSVLDGLADLPHVMRITHRQDGDDTRSVAAGIAAFLGLDLSDAAFDRALRSPPDDGAAVPGRASFREHVAARDPHARGEGGPALGDGEAPLLAALARSYAPLVEGLPLRSADWPPGLLLDWDRPGSRLGGPVPLLGPARFVICGPYLHLPLGHWRMTVRFEARDCLSDNRIEAEAFAGEVLGAVALALPRSGRYAFPIDFAVSDPSRPLELRVRLTTGAIEGSFRLLGLAFARRDIARREHGAAAEAA